MKDFTFANPIWLWGLLVLVPLLALRIRSRLQTSRSLPGLVSPRLMKRLVSGNSQAVRWSIFALHSLALAGIFAALARPQYGFDEIETETESRSLIVAIDTSRSMLATDLPPDRLSRAKLAAIDIVQSLPEDRVGLIAFAGRPFLQAPLTNDHEAIIESIEQLDTEIIPRGGTNLTAAARLALETFEESEVETSALVVFSDGEALEGGEEMERLLQESKETGMAIITVGVGTASGSIIPELDDTGRPLPGVFIKDETGQVVRSRLDPAELKRLASNGGTYVHLGGQTSLTKTIGRIKKSLSVSREEGATRLRPIERFMWPLAFAVACLVFAHLVPMLWPKPKRKSSFAVIGTPTRKAAVSTILFAFLAPAVTDARDGLWAGHEAFEKKDYQGAITAYEGALAERPSPKDRTRLELAIGAAAFREGDYERAAQSYGLALAEADGSLREHAHYNLGNTLFRKGEAALQARNKPANPDAIQTLSGPGEAVETTIAQWESAIEHYESALDLDANNGRTAHNIEIVKKRLEELKKQEEQQQEQEQQKEEEQEDEEEKEEEQQEEEKKEEEQENEEQDDSGNGEEDQQENEEQNQEGDENEQKENEEEKKPDEPESESEDERNPENEENSEGDQEEEQNQDPNEGQPDQPQEEPQQPEEPEDGELEANADQPQPPPPSMSQADMQANPETGYSPSEARQLLEALADETEVRPVLMPAGNEKYKNW